MRYLSVCSGIEAASVAWHPLGWQPWAFAEIDKFPSAVLAHHYPSVPNLGDMTQYQEWPDAGIDVLVGGTPCQSFSVAGLRAGLADPRGSLMLTYLALAGRYRPRWVVWENVPGVRSSGDGRDLGAFLGGLGELGYGWAYRSLDAQYFDLAQRRERVFVVGHLGDWRRAAAVLFERASLSGDSAPRREAREGVATFSPSSIGGYSDGGGTLRRNGGDLGGGSETLIAHSLRADGFDASEDGTGRGTPLVAFTAKDYGADAGDIAPTLRAGGFTDSHANGGVMPAVAFNWQSGGDARGLDPRPMAQLQRCQVPAVAFAENQRAELVTNDTAGSLKVGGGKPGQGYPAVMVDANYNKGISHASTQETHASSLLRALRQEVGAEAFTEWGLGILESLLPAEVLRSRLHGRGLRRQADFSRRWLVYHALARPEAHSEGLMLAMREAERQGRASQGWRPPEQLARELGTYLSELSQPGAQATRFMRDLWQAAEGIGLLRQALSAVQEVGRPSGGEGEPAHAGMSVRRLTVEECEFLQGFPRGYTSVPYRGKPAKDGPRYKALGNSMAVPMVRWIGQRIDQVDAIAEVA